MTEGVLETPIVIFTRKEPPASLAENDEVRRDHFVQASTRDLILLRRAARLIVKNKQRVTDSQREDAEQMYKQSSLELFFRLQGDVCREAYHKWPAIKKKKREAWEENMQAKYGDNWELLITDEDRSLLVSTAEELKVYASHKAIEERAMRLRKKDINELCRRENIHNPEKPLNYFKLVKIRTLAEYPQLDEREVHRAVYSFDFFFFYMNQMYKEMISSTINALRGKEENAAVVLERNLLDAVNKVCKIVEMNRRRPQKNVITFFSG